MYITEMELMQTRLEAEHRWSEGQMLKEIIFEDANSKKKKEMLEGERYYSCQHDVLQKNFSVKHFSETYKREDGTEEERIKLISNPNRSNYHVVCPFHHILVEQKVSYLVAKEPSILLKGKEDKKYEEYMATVADEYFNSVLYEWIVGASNKVVPVE